MDLETNRTCFNKNSKNYSENVLKNYLFGTALLHNHLVVLENCNALFYKELLTDCHDAVKIIGAGLAFSGLDMASLIGSGMLAAAVVGLNGQMVADSLIKIINYFKYPAHIMNEKNTQSVPVKILIIIDNNHDYILDVIYKKSLIVDNEGLIKLFVYQNAEDQSIVNVNPLPFIYKIAGALAEKGCSLSEIYNYCSNMKNYIKSLGFYINRSLDKKENESFKLVHNNTIICSSDPVIVNKPAAEMICNHFMKFLKNNEFNPTVAVSLQYFGNFQNFELSIYVRNIVSFMNLNNVEIYRIYTMPYERESCIDGFVISLLNLSSNLELIKYLESPVTAFGRLYPNKNISGNFNQNECIIKKENKELSDNFKLKSKTFCTDINKKESDVLLMSLNLSCDAIIACKKQIDHLDKTWVSKSVEKCGTRLAKAAANIKDAISSKKIFSLSCSYILIKVAEIFYQPDDPQAKIYSLFFSTLGEVLKVREIGGVEDWITSFNAACNSIKIAVEGSQFYSAILVAYNTFQNTYRTDLNNIVEAVEKSALAAQQLTANIDQYLIVDSFESVRWNFLGPAGAHAVGVLIRGIFEGMKLKYALSSCKKEIEVNESNKIIDIT